MEDLSFVLSFDLMQQDVEDCKREFNANGVEGCRRYLEGKQNEWKTIPLNIAVIGNSGVGKSSFINAIRRLTADDEGAAAVGVTECTTDIRDYCHPNNPLLKFWDLPGVGTDRFPKETYLEAINVDQYDFFLLLSATRFTENDTWLGNEITKRCKKYFYIRTKIGTDISNDRKAHPKSHEESLVVSQIRQSTEDHLKAHGSESTRVFLIDSYKQMKFDFDLLEQSLIKDFPAMKRSAMILTMCAFSEEMIKLKVAELRSRVWKASVASAAVAACPVPGLSIVFDTALVKRESDLYFKQLGLDDSSLHQRAALTSASFDELKSIVNKTCGPAFLGIQGIKTIAQFVPKGILASTTSMAVEEVARYIPFIGSLIAAPISFGGTYYMLKVVLDTLENVALEVVRYSAEHAAVSCDDEGD
jgi:predicted GTPase